ncbi:hypothetical protein ANO14919_048050 [Xylariales sp. No.14919]|nr:hypothetical protein ANO14919_048050 [Xylariales sp. No.14919]
MWSHAVSAQHVLCTILLAALSWTPAVLADYETPVPKATVKNGTINGRYLAGTWDQDLFLGIPYAQPPTGPLRFKSPQPLNDTYDTPLDASSYGYSCYQESATFDISEDCLTLNGKSSPHLAKAC